MPTVRSVRIVLILALLFAFTTPWAFAQGIVTGSLSGTVLDQSGAAVSGATVTAIETQTNRTFTAKSNAQGAYQMQQLPPGTYNIKITAANFENIQYPAVQVVVGRDTSIGIAKLNVGGEQQTVTVEGAAPLVETSSIQMQETFTAKQTADLPLAGGFDQLALFVPGAVSTGASNFSNTNGAEISVNGQRGRSNNFQIDGQSNNDSSVAGPSIFFGNQDVISELQVITNYTAEYGHNMGSVINYVTKSGTNQFHGTAYEYHQNSAFDSLTNEEKSQFHTFSGPNGNLFCLPGQVPGQFHFADGSTCDEPTVPKFIDNRFGGTVGGPILKDKLWFFGSTNFERQRTAGSPSNSGTTVTPTAAGVQQLAAAFPNNPAVAALQQFGPFAITAGNPVAGATQVLPVTGPGGTTLSIPFATITRFVPSLFNDYEGTGRVDTQIGSKDRLFGRYVFQQQLFTGISGANGTAVGDFVDVPGRDQQIGLDWTRTWTNSFLDQTRFSYSRVNFGFQGGAHPNCLITNINNCPPTIAFTSAGDANFGLDTGFPQGRINNLYTLQNNANVQHGRHAFKFGGEWDKQRSPNVFLPNTNGQFTFADTLDANGNVTTSAFSNFLQNNPQNVLLTLGTPTFRFKENDLAFYFQDDWRIKDNLTLNLGLRWEYFQQAINLLHDLTVQQQTGATPFWDPSLPLSVTTVPHIPSDTNNFGPVVGFAWTPRIWQGLFGQEKTVIRGGFRMAYDPAFYNIFLNVATSAPVVDSLTLPLAGQTLAPGLPSGTINGSTIQAAIAPTVPPTNPGLSSQVQVAPNFHNPYSEQWNFGIQRQINNRVAAEIRYVGNHSVGLFQSFNANPALSPLINAGFANLIPAGLTPCSTPGAPGFTNGNVNCNFTNVLMRGNTGYSHYNGLQTELRVQNWHGFAGNISYTFSKTIDNASEIFSTVSGGQTVSFAQNPFNIARGEQAVSGFDYPHNLAVSLIYDIPLFAKQQGGLARILGGWQWNATYRYNSGQPYTNIQNYQTGSLCDPTNNNSVSRDSCRPILFNQGAPFTNVGVCTDPTVPGCGLVSRATQQPMALGDAHWIINNPAAANFFGSPFLGVSRNLLRGESVNAVNMSMFKNTKITERLNMRFEVTAFNPFNTQFRGTPGLNVSRVNADPLLNTFGNTRGNPSGDFNPNAVDNGLGQRRLQFGAKLIF